MKAAEKVRSYLIKIGETYERVANAFPKEEGLEVDANYEIAVQLGRIFRKSVAGRWAWKALNIEKVGTLKYKGYSCQIFKYRPEIYHMLNYAYGAIDCFTGSRKVTNLLLGSGVPKPENYRQGLYLFDMVFIPDTVPEEEARDIIAHEFGHFKLGVLNWIFPRMAEIFGDAHMERFEAFKKGDVFPICRALGDLKQTLRFIRGSDPHPPAFIRPFLAEKVKELTIHLDVLDKDDEAIRKIAKAFAR
ncbi:MAG: hypothetical protein DRQ04_06565 [Candidatus Hydrothermota bacterium]|nr:MAG: hypothetical protein DRQ04_06565 [Candidatus Hydrothermae bacterium]